MRAIEIDNIAKKFTISHDLQAQRYKSISESVTNSWKNIKNRTVKRVDKEEFWALKNVTFNVEQGERVAIIGRNGAGKSTLLKILGRITEPTAGAVRIRGRVASLLEVGTGFHPELTGRENIFLNGSILGMSRVEIKSKFDEIVAFAETEKFLDTPVKRYSSGMYVRLAFAVAAHLEPEVLIVDEVLSVGDAQFQKKCLGKMEDISKGQGRTVLFVSHNMQAVTTLCTHGVFLQKGIASPKMSAREAVGLYTASIEEKKSIKFPVERPDYKILEFSIKQHGLNTSEFDGGHPIDLEISFELFQDLQNFRIGVFLKNQYGELITRSLLADWQREFSSLTKGLYRMTGKIPNNFFAAGTFHLSIHSSRYGLVDYGTEEETRVTITVRQSLEYNQAYIGEEAYGIVLTNSNWNLERV